MSVWRKTEKGLNRSFSFDSFTDCIDFLANIAAHCDAVQHHPDIVFTNPFEIELYLFTHDQGQITKKDELLAKFIDEVAS